MKHFPIHAEWEIVSDMEKKQKKQKRTTTTTMAMITNRRREMHAVISRNMFSFYPLPPLAHSTPHQPYNTLFYFGFLGVSISHVDWEDIFVAMKKKRKEITSNELNRRQSVCLPRLLPSIDKINFSFQHLYLVVLW